MTGAERKRASDPEQVPTLLGFTVERVEDARDLEPAYILSGPRGARYGLIRQLGSQSTTMFVENLRGGGRASPKGVAWFTDRRGVLEPAPGWDPPGWQPSE
jgi:hypothetical protein